MLLVSEGTSEGSKNKDNCILTGQSQPRLVISNVQANSSIVIMDLPFSTVKSVQAALLLRLLL